MTELNILVKITVPIQVGAEIISKYAANKKEAFFTRFPSGKFAFWFPNSECGILFHRGWECCPNVELFIPNKGDHFSMIHFNELMGDAEIDDKKQYPFSGMKRYRTYLSTQFHTCYHMNDAAMIQIVDDNLNTRYYHIICQHGLDDKQTLRQYANFVEVAKRHRGISNLSGVIICHDPELDGDLLEHAHDAFKGVIDRKNDKTSAIGRFTTWMLSMRLLVVNDNIDAVADLALKWWQNVPEKYRCCLVDLKKINLGNICKEVLMKQWSFCGHFSRTERNIRFTALSIVIMMHLIDDEKHDIRIIEELTRFAAKFMCENGLCSSGSALMKFNK